MGGAVELADHGVGGVKLLDVSVMGVKIGRQRGVTRGRYVRPVGIRVHLVALETEQAVSALLVMKLGTDGYIS